MKKHSLAVVLTLVVTLLLALGSAARAWADLPSSATGTYIITTNGNNIIYTFTGNGTFTPALGLTANILVVGGGGGGGGCDNGGTRYGGGGGAGGFVSQSGIVLTANTQYTVTVGAGGSGGTSTARGGNGGNSVFGTYTATDGGAGGTAYQSGGNGVYGGANGGSGGGGGRAGSSSLGTAGSGTSSQGNNGVAANTSWGGGGGGASAAGSSQNGGPGTASSITGTSVTYAGGGGGGGSTAGNGGAGGGGAGATAGNGNPGAANTGGGGGGGAGSNTARSGGTGGSGVVIVSYTLPTPQTIPGTATAAAASGTSIAVTMPYGGDVNGNNTYTVEYKFSSGSTWTTWVANAAHTASPYTTTITGLTPGASYDVRVTYNDPDGIWGSTPQTQTITAVLTTSPGITVLSAWSNLYHNTATTVQNIPYSVPAGTSRALIVAIASSQTAVGSRSVTLSYGGQPLTPVNGDMGAATIQQHTALYYLNEAGLDSATTATLSVSVSGGTTRITDVFAAVYDAVDQTTPVVNSQTWNNGTTAGNIFALTSGLAVNAENQAVEVVCSDRTGNTTPRTVNTYATSWSSAGIDQTWITTDGVRDLVTTRAIPTTDVAADTTSTTMSGSSLGSMTALSLGNLKATPAVIWPSASGITYGQALSASTLWGGESAVFGTFAFTSPSTVPTAAGNYSASVTFTPTDTANYKTVSGNVNVMVAKATPTLSVLNSPVTYNGSPQSGIVNGSVPGTVSNVRYDGAATPPTAVGTYAVTADFAPTDSADYNSLIGASAGYFVINPGALDHFAISAISSPQTVGAPITGITLTAQDAFNNTVTSFSGAGNTVSYGGTAGITGTSGAFTLGVLSGVSVAPLTAGAGRTFTVTASGKTGTSTFDVNPGALAHFAVATPGTPPTAGTPFAIATVTAQDANNNTVTSFTGTVDLSETGGGAGGTVSPSQSSTFSQGVLSGQSVTLTKSGTGVTLTATDHAGTAASGVSSAFTVNAGTAAQLVFTTVPSTGIAGTAFSVTVQSRDANGNPANVTSATTITLSKASGGGTLSGTLTGTIANGANSVTISTPVYSKPDTMTLTATATAGMTGLPPVTSGNIVFSAGTATHLVYTSVPSTGIAGTPFSVTVQAQDANGNPANVTSATTITLSKASGAGTLSGTLTGTIANGANSVTISTPVYSKSDTITLTASRTAGMTGLASVTSGNIVFSPGALDHYSVVAPTATRGAAFNVIVTAQDANNNTVTSDSSTVVTMSGSTANVLFDATGDGSFNDNTKTLSSGAFTISTKDTFAEPITITATDGNGKTGSASVTLGAATGDYRSNVGPSGNWDAKGSWQTWNGSSWGAASSAPSGAAGVSITIQSGDTITLQTQTGTLNLSGVLDVAGTLSFSGAGAISVGSTGIVRNSGTVNGSATTLTFNSGGIYEHNYTTSAGTIPTATWNAGSICEISGYTTSTAAPSGLGQSFDKLIWNCPAQTANISESTALTGVSSLFELDDTGAGILTLNAANTYSGATLLAGGTLRLGQVSQGVTVPNFNFATPSEASSPYYAYTPSGASWTFSAAGIAHQNSSNPWFGNVAPPSGTQAGFVQGQGFISQSINFPAPGQYTITFSSIGRSGTLGPNPMKLQVDGTDVLSWTPTSKTAWNPSSASFIISTAGNHTINFQGTATTDLSSCINNVVITGAQPNVLPATTALSIGNGATLDLNGVCQALASLADYGTGGGTVTNTALGVPVVLTLSAASGTTTFSGALTDGSGTIALVKTGNSTQVLAGANSYSGGTTVNGGVLKVSNTSGLASGSGAVSVAGATLASGASGSAGNVTTSGSAHLSPGDESAAGTLTVGALSLNSSASIDLDLSNTTTVGGGINDLLVVNGDFDPAGSSINVNEFAGGLVDGGTYTVVQYTGTRVGSHTFSGVNFAGGPAPSNYTLSYDDSATPHTVKLTVMNTVLVSSSANPSTYGQSVSFTATVRAQGGGTASGTVQFQTNGVNFGAPVTVVNGSATSAAISTLPAGNCTVTATFTDSTTLNTATGTLPNGQTVNKASLVVTANDRSKPYGTTLSLGTAAFTSSGLQNGETIGSVTLTASGGTDPTAPLGTYTITPSAATGGTFAASNYSISYANGTLTVVPGAIASYVVSATTPQTAGTTFNITVTAKDSGGNTVTGDNSTVVTLTSSTGHAQFDGDADGTFDNNTRTLTAGAFTIPVRDSMAETITVTATDSNAKSGTSSSIAINPGTLDHYVVSAASPRTVGAAFAVTVTAKDALNNTVTTDGSTQVTLTSSGSLQFDANNNGVFGEANDNRKTLSSGTFAIQAKDATAETVTLTATDGNNKTGTLTGLVIRPLSDNFPFWRTVTISHTKVVGTQTNFPVLISLTDPALAAHAQTNGFDILFTASDGSTLLSYERESYSSATGALLAWVKVPTLNSTADTVLYLYYGNPNAADQQNRTAAWDTNFKAVWHLDESGNGTAGEYKDSTASANNAQGRGGIPSQADGKIGPGQLCKPSNQEYMESANNIGITNNAVRTISFWTFVTSSNRMAWVGWGSNINNGEFEAAIRPANVNQTGQGELFLWGYGANDWQTGVSPLANSWHYHSIVHDGTKAHWYLDGTEVLSGFTHTYATYDSHVFIGFEYDVAGQSSVAYLDGYIDEVHVANTNRPLSWIQTEYNNQLDPTLFSTLGPEQTAITTTVASSANPSVYGQPVSFAATVTWAAGTPTGTVQFQTNGANFGSPVTLINGSATSAPVSNLSAGTTTVTAIFTDGITPNLSSGTLTNGQVVTQAPLTVTANNTSKTYSQTATLSGSAFTASGLQNGETIGSVMLSSSGAPPTAAIGTYSIEPSAATGGTFRAANYAITYAPTGTLTVNPKPLTVTANSASKTYGTALTFAGTEFTTSGLVNGDTVTSVVLGSSGAPAIAPATTYSIVPSSASGSGLGNYTLSYANGTLTVGRKALTVTAVPNTKVYDGSTSSSKSPTATGLVNGDLPNFSQSFDTKDVGTGKTLTPAGSASDGNGGNNYAVTFVTSTGGSITPASLTVNGITAASKVYDGTPSARLSLASAGLSGVIGQDIVALQTNGVTGAFADKAAGNGKIVTIGGLAISGRDAPDYTLIQPTTTANINPAALTVTSITANNKAYDGTTNATLNLANAALAGVLDNDSVSLITTNASGGFEDALVGNGKTVHVSGLLLAGADAANYTLTAPTTAASITAAGLTVTGITANNKVYDATTSVSLNLAGAQLQGVLGNDKVTLILMNATGAFVNAAAGPGKTVLVNGLTLIGQEADNYTLTPPITKADITPAGLTVTGVTANNKVYDGTTNASLNLGNARLSGVISGDLVGLDFASAAGAFADKTVGDGKTVTVSSLALTDRDAANYTLTQPSTTANITPAGLTVNGITANNKVYDRSTTATLNGTPTLAGAVHGDSVTLDGTPVASFADKTVANNKPVTVAGFVLGGTDAGNYSLAQPAGLKADIAPAGLTVNGITANNKPYDGTTAATLNLGGATLNGVLSGDNVSLNTSGAIGNFADPTPGHAKTVYVSGLSLNGLDAANYLLAQPTATATITAMLDHFAITVNGPLTAGTPFSITITAQDFSNDTVSDFNGSVDLTTTAGTISPTSSGTFVAGVLTVPGITVTGAGAGKTITATDHAGSGKTGTSAGFTVNPGAVSAANSTIRPATASIQADGISTQVITVQARDLYNNNLTTGGATVVFSKTGGGTLSGTTDRGDGTYTATLSSSTVIGSATVSATLGGTSVDTWSGTQHYAVISFVAGQAVAALSTLTPATATKPSDGTTTLLLTVQARDIHTNNLASGSSTVEIFKASGGGTLSATTDNGNGTYTATWTSPTTTGTTILGATLDGVAVGTSVGASNCVVTIVPGPVDAAHSTVTAAPASNVTADGISFSTITVTVRDAHDNPIPGQTVNLSVAGYSYSISSPAPTDATGRTTAILKSTSTDTKTVTASVGSTTINQRATVGFVAGALNLTKSSVGVSPGNNVLADGVATATITVILEDGNENPLIGQTVALSVSGTGNTLSTPPVTDANGRTTATLKSTTPETKVITATVGSITLRQNPTVTFVPGPATHLVFSIQPGSATYGQPLAPQPVVKAKDALGNDSTVGLGTSKIVTLTLSGGSGALQGTAAVDIGTNAGNGVATFTGLKLSTVGNKQLTASAPELASAVSTSFTISPLAITVTAVPASKTYDGTTASAGIPSISAALASGDISGFTQSYSDKNVGIGNKTLTPSGAVVDGNNGSNYLVTFVAVSTGTISAAPTTTSLSSSLNPALPASNLTFTATVTAVGAGNAVASGTVQFQSNGTNNGPPVALAGGQASFTAPASSLGHGSHPITALYANTDGNFVASSSAPLGQVVNTPPVADTQLLVTPMNMPLSIAASDLASVEFDPDGDPLTIASVSSVTASNGIVQFQNGTITYTPPGGFSGTDHFTFVVSDPFNGTATSTIDVAVQRGGFTSIIWSVSVHNGVADLVAYGIPGKTYDIQTTTTLQDDQSWQRIGSATADATSGIITFTDPKAGGTSRYYRLASQ